MFQFIKNWTLPLAMLVGVLAYCGFTNIPLLIEVKPYCLKIVSYLTPSLIFAQLLLTFCKVDTSDLLPKVWHVWLLLFQIIGCFVVVAVIELVPMPVLWKEAGEGVMVCLICPTATAAAVVTGKLGGNAASLTTYTLFSNLAAALVVPLLFPLVEPHSDLTFAVAFLRILGKVFPLLLCPFILSVILRRYFKNVHTCLLGMKDAAFYLWAIALSIVMAQTCKSVIDGDATLFDKMAIALGALLICCIQFAFGKIIGGYYGDRISGGQALGQKNTVLAIWMAVTYLNPLSAIAPGSYVVWQNTINSWQLWKKRTQEVR